MSFTTFYSQDYSSLRSQASEVNDDIIAKMNFWSHQETKNFSTDYSLPTQCRAMYNYKNHSWNIS